MQRKRATFVLAGLLVVVLSSTLAAQVPDAAVSVKVTDAAGVPVENATFAIRNLGTGESAQVQTNAAGFGEVSRLLPGDYDITVSAAGFTNKLERVTLASGAIKPMNITLSRPLSLGDLGYSGAETRGNPQEQARLDKRTHMLKMHQRLGLITTAPLLASLLTGNLAAGRETSSTGRNVHAALGATTAGLYFTTASFAIFAPKVQGTKTRGPIRLHKALAWIHGPGMVLTPILGAMAYNQKSNGEKVHGIASAHTSVAIVTAAAYGAAILSVSVRIKKHDHD